MIKWKYILAMSVACSSLFAETTKVVIPTNSGKVILKDKDNKEFEIKNDSKLTISIKPSDSLDKSVLQNLFQVKIASDKQEVLLDVVQEYNTDLTSEKTASISATNIYYRGLKASTKQDLDVFCFSNIEVKEKDLTYETGSVECVKTTGCRGYTLGIDKKFKFGDLGTSGVCVGKKEASISKTVPTYQELFNCKIYDVAPDTKTGAMITYTRDLPNLKEKHVKSTTGDCK